MNQKTLLCYRNLIAVARQQCCRSVANSQRNCVDVMLSILALCR